MAHLPPVPASTTLNDLAALFGDLDRLFSDLSKAKRKHRLSNDELLLLLVLGRCSLGFSSFGVSVKAVRYSDIARLMRIPKETVRRKFSKLIDRGFVDVTARGVILQRLDDWAQLAAIFSK